MAALQIRKATKKKAKLRLNIEGQPGGGKTYSSIKLAKLIIGEPFKLPEGQTSKVVLLDTERNSAELYADEFDFNVIELDIHEPRFYVDGIRAAEKFGAEAIICDSITHEWRWCLAEADRQKPKFHGNKWAAWGPVKPLHDDFIDAMMGCKAHLIATTRVKPKTDQEEDEKGRKKIVKLGMESIQDDQIEYAFTLVLRMDGDNNGIVHKTRCKHLRGKVFPLPGEELADILRDWLNSGEAEASDAEAAEQVKKAREEAKTKAEAHASSPQKSAGLSAEITRALDYVFSAPNGERVARFGEVKTSLAAWCEANGVEFSVAMTDLSVGKDERKAAEIRRSTE